MNQNDIPYIVKSILPFDRLKHSIGVANTIKMLLKRFKDFNVSDDFFYKCAIFHDVGKYLSIDQVRYLSEKYNLKERIVHWESFDNPDIMDFKDILNLIENGNSPRLSHGLLSAYFFKEELNEKQIECIEFHTTGKYNLSIECAVFMIADFCEPNRCFSEAKKLYNEIMNKKIILKYDIYLWLDRVIVYKIKYLLKNRKVICPYSLETYNFLRGILNEFKI